MDLPSATKTAKNQYDKACSLIRGELALHENQFRKPPNLWTRIKLWRAERLLREVLKTVPDNWASMWFLGKIVQRFGREREAFDWFEKAWDLKPKNADVAREAALSAMHLGMGQHAIEYSEEALKIEPNEPGLLCNLGLAHLHAGHPQQALEYVEEAMRVATEDKVSENVLRIIRHIIATNAKCPSNSAELDKFCKVHREIFK